MSNHLQIRPMIRTEVDFALDLAAKEGWNPGLFDAGVFYAADPAGFLVGYSGEKPVGCISAVSYPGNFGFIGFYIVIPEFRGRGFGIQLWNRAIECLNNHNIGLDSVFEQQDNYRKSGFEPAYSSYRFEHYFKQKDIVEAGDVRDLKEFPFEQILEYDGLCFPVERRAFLENWLKMPQSKAFGYAEAGKLQGYGLIRKCRAGYKIGPLFADDKNKALALYNRLCAQADPHEPIYLDVPEINAAGMELAEDFNMKKVFGTGRMYRGVFPDIKTNKIFGITTFELG
jgi:GNAT superfamily N-acetyltransferase